MSTLPDFKLTDEDVWVDLYTLNPSESLTVTARVISGTASDVGVSLIWQEDF